MKEIARQIIQAALKAVDPYQAVSAQLTREGDILTCGKKTYDLNDFERVRVIGFGKGSVPMARAVHALLPDLISDGLVIVKYGHTESGQGDKETRRVGDLGAIELVEAGHPTPDDNSVNHTARLSSMLADGRESDLIICVISGGGSALLTGPAVGLSLACVQSLTQTLLEVGATINETNAIRKHLSKVKGGRLARLAQPATLLNLILSDVGDDSLDIIASGPTAPDPSTFADALAIMEKYRLNQRAHPSVPAYLQAGLAGEHPETLKPGDPAFEKVQHLIVANNRMALDAAAQKAHDLGWNTLAQSAFIEGEARDVARKFVGQAVSLSGDTVDKLTACPTARPAALLLGGETTVTIQGKGVGGRNQEMALAAAIELKGLPNTLAAFFATDGNDGPTDAAGAFANGETVAKGAAAGLDAQSCLDNNDSYRFFQAIDDLIITGPTNTNVNDIALALMW